MRYAVYEVQIERFCYRGRMYKQGDLFVIRPDLARGLLRSIVQGPHYDPGSGALCPVPVWLVGFVEKRGCRPRQLGGGNS